MKSNLRNNDAFLVSTDFAGLYGFHNKVCMINDVFLPFDKIQILFCHETVPACQHVN